VASHCRLRRNTRALKGEGSHNPKITFQIPQFMLHMLALALPAATLHVFDSAGHALERRVPAADLQVPHAA